MYRARCPIVGAPAIDAVLQLVHHSFANHLQSAGAVRLAALSNESCGCLAPVLLLAQLTVADYLSGDLSSARLEFKRSPGHVVLL